MMCSTVHLQFYEGELLTALYSKSAAVMEGAYEAVLRMFLNKHPYEEILEHLHFHHRVKISLSTFKRWLRKNKLHKRATRSVRTDYNVLVDAVLQELEGSG